MNKEQLNISYDPSIFLFYILDYHEKKLLIIVGPSGCDRNEPCITRIKYENILHHYSNIVDIQRFVFFV